jgi:hypothetical protein
MEHKISLEKKMELAQYIREENLDNRQKIRQRESIFYGTDNKTPLYTKDNLSYDKWNRQENTELSVGLSGSFKVRMIIAVLLFAAFLLCDTNGGKIGQYTTDDVYQLIAEDTFSETVSDNFDLADLLAFKK